MLAYEEYVKYRDAWDAETCMMSCWGTNYQSFRDIVALGKDIVPHVIHDFKIAIKRIDETGKFDAGYPRLAFALEEVTGERPADDSKDTESWQGMMGVNMEQMMRLWVKWYDDKNA